MLRQIRASDRDSGRGRGVDIEVLLQGAEKLCAAYEVSGAMDRISALRLRHEQISRSIASYENQISNQQVSMGRFSTRDDEGDRDNQHDAPEQVPMAFSEQDLAAEEDAIQELESKKKALEARVAGMERDLGGLMR